ncbi:hypothetical protein FOH38_23405 [Lysinibacillus fusiformis]|nr:hypothetical protein FOH38_23405 [Lysinibacillus fusiformis]
MSSSVRDMHVGINIRDEATRALSRIDATINNLERNFRRFGSNINGSFRGMNGLNSRIDASAENMRTLQQYTSRLEQEMSEARTEMQRMAERIRIAEAETEDLRNGMQRVNSQVNTANKSMSIFGTTAGKVVGIIGTVFAADKIKGFALGSIEAAASAEAMTSQFGQVFGDLEGKASGTMESLAEKTGMMEGRLKGSFIQMAAFAKTTGMDTTQALSLSERATLAAADSAAFYDRSIEDVSDSLQSFLKGNFENDAALGISATETTRNAAAMKLYGKSFTKLAEDQKQLTLLQMVEDGNSVTGAMGQAANEADAFENVMGNLKQTWTDFKIKLGGPLLQPFVDGMMAATKWIQGFDTDKIVSGIETVKSVAGTVKDTFSALANDTKNVSGLWQKIGFSKETSDNIASFADVLHTTVTVGIEAAGVAFDGFKTGVSWVIDNKDLVISALAGVAGGFAALKGITFVKTALDLFKNSTILSTIATQGFNAALRANPIGMVVTAIGLLITVGVYLYQNWDTVKATAGSLWDKTKEVFSGIYDWASQKIQPVTGFFKGLYDKFIDFKNAITNFKPPEWVSKIGGAIGKAAGAVGNFISGSHATGLERVPFDGYVAELHKDEAVLTASQSNMLRSTGILSQGSSGTPELNLDNNNAESVPSFNIDKKNNTPTNNGSHQFIFQISGENAGDIAQKIREVISDILSEEMQLT